MSNWAHVSASDGLDRAQLLLEASSRPAQAPFPAARKRRASHMNAGFYGKICAMPAPHSTPFRPLPTPPSGASRQIVGLARANVALPARHGCDAARVCGTQASAQVVPRQLFGQKSEAPGVTRHHAIASGRIADPRHAARSPGKTVAGHTRRASHRLRQVRTTRRCSSTRRASRSRPSRSPTRDRGLTADQFEVIGGR